jgi:protein-tyrosine phosphatase
MITNLPIPDAYQISFANLSFARPVNGRLLAGEYPSAKNAAEAEAKLARFLNSGVTFFLDLTEAGEYNLRPYETAVQHMAAARGQAITHHRMAIPDVSTPTPAFMTTILDTLDERLGQGETVYVHCFGGIGRTGTVIGCWLVRHGLTGEQALAQIAAWRQGTPDGWKQSPETAAQRQMVVNWSARND